ncbi:hypothetical protein, partial [Bradyrhizobium yuanmingense]|uniref:hypothetical protein n=1 Tax=Bradyrhizobium yuanmingense TaxID=108015 RepID=UPI000566884A
SGFLTDDYGAPLRVRVMLQSSFHRVAMKAAIDATEKLRELIAGQATKNDLSMSRSGQPSTRSTAL